MDIEITFPGGKQVDARVNGFVVKTDQPADLGGAAGAPAPFDLFLASFGTCAGIYALGFCQARGLPTEGLALTQRVDLHPDTHLPTRIRLELRLPDGFPEKYRAAIQRAAENCKVKKAIAAGMAVEVALAGAPAAAAAAAAV